MKRQKIAITILSFIIIILYILHVQLTNTLSEQDVHYDDIKSQIEELKKQNSSLYEEVLKAQSLTTILEKAKEQGMEKGTFYLLQ